ncbi:hypothetical protein [Algiphilus aromaticivorans]|uniref:hypothetical protein n=1 Tax=Algiphilus aromaticivorans TaxID=382454 RepID=UPI0012EC5801|nr:hypothetical protein [Algiphilus aromaticivorans]
MRPAAGWRWMSGLSAALLVTSAAVAELAVDPRLAHAQWLLDSGHPYRAAAELASIPSDALSPAIAARKVALQEAVVGDLVAALTHSGVAVRSGGEPSLDEALRKLAQDGTDDAVLKALLDATAGSDPIARGVRDQVHLLLGRRALARGAAHESREHFSSVHSPGPYATEALLALGWSYLLPVGGDPASAGTGDSSSVWAPIATPLRATSADALAAFRRSTPFRSASGVAGSERAGDLEAALGVWQELIGRDPLDPPVQEGLLAIAYAYQHLGAREQAFERYKRALDSLRRGRDLLDDALAHVDSGALLDALRENAMDPPGGWPWWAVERRAAQWWRNGGREVPGLFYAHYLMADLRFREIAQRTQLLTIVVDRMETATQLQEGNVVSEARTVAASLRPELRSQERALQERATELMASRLALTERYMAEAHFALARMSEPGATDVAVASGSGKEAAP